MRGDGLGEDWRSSHGCAEGKARDGVVQDLGVAVKVLYVPLQARTLRDVPIRQVLVLEGTLAESRPRAHLPARGIGLPCTRRELVGPAGLD